MSQKTGSLPDWREVPEVKEAQARVRTLELACKTEERKIKETAAAAHEAERYRRSGEEVLLGGRLTGLALMGRREAEKQARQVADEVQAQAESHYQRLAEAKAELDVVETRAKKKAKRELRSLHLPAIDRLEEALAKAVEASGEALEIYIAAENQFPEESLPGGLPSLRWRWHTLNSENMAAWRAWRQEALPSPKSRTKKALDQLKDFASETVQ
ncbi:MAG: hypothetical protein Q7O66_23670 [Dehalococcoidia bacterium]|nr:hypothetical protein [Dehalococcoidia bacterium]